MVLQHWSTCKHKNITHEIGNKKLYFEKYNIVTYAPKDGKEGKSVRKAGVIVAPKDRLVNAWYNQ